MNLFTPTASAQTYGLNNPLGDTSLQGLFAAVLEIVITVAIPVVVVFLILAGFKYVTARGNPQAITDANRALLYGVIGGVIIIGAFTILAIISSTVSEFSS